MTAIDNNATSTTTLLALLHQYNTLHTTASTNFKSTLWNLTKARRGRGYQTSGGGSYGSNEYSVEGVREELEATALLEVRSCRRKEPELVDEHDGDNEDNNAVKNMKGNHDPMDMMDNNIIMVLHLDGMVGAKCSSITANEIITDENDIIRDTNNNLDGLRRRRNKGGDINDELKSKWTQEQQSEEYQNSDNTFYSDPLQLFGVPPPALRVAQSHSRDALAYYVEVANLARQIMSIVQGEETDSEEKKSDVGQR
jgi:hypothetical protein